MDLTQRFLAFTLVGANWVLWLLVVLSIVSIAIMIERLLFLARSRLSDATADELNTRLRKGDIAAAKELARSQRGIEGRVALEGLENFERGADAASEAMTAVRVRERLALESNLAVLGTLGSTAPFIGLFGTVLGIVKSFHDLAQSQGGDFKVVMVGLAEALVATATGLLVAIPAVIAFNYFQRRVRGRLARADELAHAVLAVLRAGKGG